MKFSEAGPVCIIGVLTLTGCSAIAGKWEGNLTVQKALLGTSVVGATWIIKKHGNKMCTSR